MTPIGALNVRMIQVFPDSEMHTYRFVPLALEEAVITRQPYTAGPNRLPVAPNIYLPPYAGFPELTCGAHPYIVILAASQHLQRHEQALTAEQLQAYSTMEHIRTLWNQLCQKPIDDSVLPSLEVSQTGSAKPVDSGQPRVKRARTSSS